MESKSPRLRQAWDKYHASLDAARQTIEATPRFNDSPQHRTEAYSVLMQAQTQAYNWIIAPRLNRPRIYTHRVFMPQLYTLGGPCPDIIYSILPVDGRQTYRIHGRHGDVRLLMLQVFNRPMGIDGSRCTGNYEYAKSDEGNDEINIVLSPTEQKGHWIPLDPASDFNFIFIRRIVLDWEDDAGKLEIELLGDPVGKQEDDDQLSEDDFARRIEMAADFQHEHMVKNWGIAPYDFMLKMAGGHTNTWANVPGELMEQLTASPSSNYAFLPYDIKPDEALVIELDVPANSAYWSFQLADVWGKAIDYMYAQTDFNMQQAAIDSGNKVRAVISLRDPGLLNWLDPVGRAQGLCFLRNYRSESFKQPTVRSVKLDELRQLLPTESKWVTPEQRQRTPCWRPRTHG